MYIKKRFSHRKEKRDLLIGQLYKRSNTSVASRAYTYDTLGRPMTRSTSKDGSTVNDSFGYNSRSELNTATVNNEAYAYDYDNIGNRETAQEAAEAATSYESNQLNQYTAIGDFEPTYDDAGNQTKVKTSTGIWTVVYNAENRPTSFTNADSGTIVECTYDYMGRRATKKVTVNGAVTLHHRYLYRGYLQIACCDLTRAAHPCLWLITWDPSQATATRPLAIQKDATWYTYGWDLTKNICEVYGQHGYIRTNYTYSPYGEVTISGDVTQPIQWSSEYFDSEIGLVYYNYRHYSPQGGRWMQRDSMNEMYGSNLYNYVKNSPISLWDILGEFFSQNQQNFELYIREDILFTPNSSKSCSGCNRKLKNLAMKLGERYYIAQKEQFYNRVKCKLEVTCGCTKWASAKGEHQPSNERKEKGYTIRSSKIVIPCDVAGMSDIYTHELTHAVDYCKLGMPTTCKQLLLTEFNAYSSERCSRESDYRACLLERAFNSAITQWPCYNLVGGPVKQSGNWSAEDQKKIDKLREIYEDYLDEYVKSKGR